MPLLSNLIEVSLAAVLHVILSGNLLLFTKGVHWEAKKLSKKLALILKSDQVYLVFSIWKSVRVLQKACIKIVAHTIYT